MRQVLPPPPPAARTAWRRPLLDAAVVLGVLVGLGLLCGVVWSLVVEPARFTRLPDGGAMGEDALGQQFNADGWYVVIGASAAFVTGLVMTAWRSRDPLLTSGLLVVGSLVAGGLMVLVGGVLGPADPTAELAGARIGTRVPEALDLDTLVAFLAWPAGVLAGSLFVLLGRVPAESDADTGRADAEVSDSPSRQVHNG